MNGDPTATGEPSFYELLGLGPLAPQDLVVEAYWLRTRPPVGTLPPEDVVDRLNAAYATLIDPDRRDSYNTSLGLPAPSWSPLWKQRLKAPHDWLQIDPATGGDLVRLAHDLMRRHWTDAIRSGHAPPEALRSVDQARDALMADAPWSSPPEPKASRSLTAPLRGVASLLARGIASVAQGPPPDETVVAEARPAGEERIRDLAPPEPVATEVTEIEPAEAAADARAETAEEAPPAFLMREEPEEASADAEAPAEQGEAPLAAAEDERAPARRRARAPEEPLLAVKSVPVGAVESPCLTWVAASGDVVVAPIEDFLRVGTHSLCEVRLTEEGAPDELVRIWRDPDGRYVLRHMPGTGTVAINGRPVIWAELEDGDVIDLHGCTVTFRESGVIAAAQK